MQGLRVSLGLNRARANTCMLRWHVYVAVDFNHCKHMCEPITMMC